MIPDSPIPSFLGTIGRDQLPPVVAVRANPGLAAQWLPEQPREPQVLSTAEVEDCRCPDFCNRDHSNE